MMLIIASIIVLGTLILYSLFIGHWQDNSDYMLLDSKMLLRAKPAMISEG